MTRTDIINGLIRKNGYKTYLEIGLDSTENYRQVVCEHKESVDPYFLVDGRSNGERIVCGDDGELLHEIKECLTYRCTSDELFEKRIGKEKKYDIVFIDGLHERRQVVRDVINSMKHLNEGGMIVCHDCLPNSEMAQKMPRVSGEWNGDVWKGMRFLIEKGYPIEVVDTDYGCGIVKYTDKCDDMDMYRKFDYEYKEVFGEKEVRDEMMNVIGEEEFTEKYL